MQESTCAIDTSTSNINRIKSFTFFSVLNTLYYCENKIWHCINKLFLALFFDMEIRTWHYIVIYVNFSCFNHVLTRKKHFNVIVWFMLFFYVIITLYWDGNSSLVLYCILRHFVYVFQRWYYVIIYVTTNVLIMVNWRENTTLIYCYNIRNFFTFLSRCIDLGNTKPKMYYDIRQTYTFLTHIISTEIREASRHCAARGLHTSGAAIVQRESSCEYTMAYIGTAAGTIDVFWPQHTKKCTYIVVSWRILKTEKII